MANFLINLFGNTIPSWLTIFILSLIPTIELRGGVLAAKALSVPMINASIICLIGTLLPIPFILLFIERIMKWLEKTRFSGFVDFLNKKVEKNKAKIQKYEMFGLMLFVAIPLPGTGAWTGALVASVLKMDFKYSMLFIALGSLIADVIMLLVSYGALGLIF